MESLPVALSAMATLAPLALYASRSCLTRIRDARCIKKQVLLMPSGSGKSWLTRRLAGQQQFLVVDVDEAIRVMGDEKLVRHFDQSKSASLDHEADLTYTELALQVLKKTKERLLADKKLKVLFITSSYRFASHFKRDSIMCAAPSAEAFEEALSAKPVEEQNRLRKERNAFTSSLPNTDAVYRFKKLDELESAIRVRLGILDVL